MSFAQNILDFHEMGKYPDFVFNTETRKHLAFSVTPADAINEISNILRIPHDKACSAYINILSRILGTSSPTPSLTQTESALMNSVRRPQAVENAQPRQTEVLRENNVVDQVIAAKDDEKRLSVLLRPHVRVQIKTGWTGNEIVDGFVSHFNTYAYGPTIVTVHLRLPLDDVKSGPVTCVPIELCFVSDAAYELVLHGGFVCKATRLVEP